ncbi:alpha/beta hydrolase [Domibacillus indicus]|uniref:alpha/beta hydrolase n=1 Tax=Domibacillus indicus TaxID=1437523 RepID=UPI000618357A|nr:alpha/beta hydrolase [Domibacillus indicus]
MKKEMILHSFDGTELYVQRDAPRNPHAVIVIVHGLGEHSGRYEYVTEKLNGYGYAVYRFDNRGHGKSGGARGYIEDASKFVDDAHKVVRTAQHNYPGLPLFMLGHSMGGFIAAAYGVQHKDTLAGQIFSGPVIQELPAFEDLKQLDMEKEALTRIPNGLSHLICRSQAIVEDYENDPYNLKEFTVQLLTSVFHEGVQKLLKKLPLYTYPCFILHGENDQIVPADSGRYLYERISSEDKSICIIPQLYHEILNEEKEKDEILQEIYEWIEERA